MLSHNRYIYFFFFKIKRGVDIFAYYHINYIVSIHRKTRWIMFKRKIDNAESWGLIKNFFSFGMISRYLNFAVIHGKTTIRKYFKLIIYYIYYKFRKIEKCLNITYWYIFVIRLIKSYHRFSLNRTKQQNMVKI